MTAKTFLYMICASSDEKQHIYLLLSKTAVYKMYKFMAKPYVKNLKIIIDFHVCSFHFYLIPFSHFYVKVVFV